MSRTLKNLVICLVVFSLALGAYPCATATESYDPRPPAQSARGPEPSSGAVQPQPAPETEIVVPGATTPTFARPASPNLATDYFAATNRSLDIICKPTPRPEAEPIKAPEESLAFASANTSTELSSSEQSEYRSIVRKFFGMDAADKQLAFEYIRRLSPVELMQVTAWFIRGTRETKALLYAKLEQHFTQQEIEKMEELVYKYR